MKSFVKGLLHVIVITCVLSSACLSKDAVKTHKVSNSKAIAINKTLSIEFYHLKDIQLNNNPKGYWEIACSPE